MVLTIKILSLKINFRENIIPISTEFVRTNGTQE